MNIRGKVIGTAVAALALAACEVPVKKTVKYCWVSEMQFDIEEGGGRRRLGQAITPWHIDLGFGFLTMSGRIRGTKEQRDVLPTRLDFLLRHYNSTGNQVLDEFPFSVPVRRNGKFRLPKTRFSGFELQQFEQVELFVEPIGGDILLGSEFGFCNNYKRATIQPK